MIEQIIHQIWLQDSHNFNIQTNLDNKKNIIKNSSAPNDIKKLMIETVQINPEFNYILWCEDNIKNLVRKYYREYYNFFLKMTFIQKIDFAKIIIIHFYGGIYLDCDIKPIKPIISLISNLPSNRLIISEAAKLNYFENNILEKIFKIPNSIKINNGVLISSRNNKLLLKLCNEIILRINNKNIGIINYFLTNNSQIDTMRTTGPACITSFVNENLDKNKIIIINNQLFEPCLGSNIFCRETELSYGKHLHKSYWFMDGYFYNFSYMYFIFRKYWLLFVILLLIFYLRKQFVIKF